MGGGLAFPPLLRHLNRDFVSLFLSRRIMIELLLSADRNSHLSSLTVHYARGVPLGASTRKKKKKKKYCRDVTIARQQRGGGETSEDDRHKSWTEDDDGGR